MALVTLARVQTLTGISTDAARVSALIPIATSRMETFCSVDSFEDASYTELHDGEGADAIVLRHVPVNTLTSVKLTDGTTTVTVDADTYTYDPDSGELSFRGGYPWAFWDAGIPMGERPGFPEGFRNVEVVYNGGHQTVPPDLEMACAEIVAWMYHNAGANLALTSQRLGQYGESRGAAGGAGGLQSFMEERLGNYRRGGV